MESSKLYHRGWMGGKAATVSNRTIKWEHIAALFSSRNTLGTTRFSCCCLNTKTSQLPHIVMGLKNGFQGQVTFRFKGQGSESQGSPSHPAAEDKAHIESRPWRLKVLKRRSEGLSKYSEYSCFIFLLYFFISHTQSRRRNANEGS